MNTRSILAILCSSLGLCLALMLVWLLGCGVPAVQAATRCVDPTGAGGCFTTIQAAVNAASAGDVITITTGTYTENLTVTVSLTFIGVGADSTIVNGNNLDRVFDITADDVSIFDLTIENGNIAGDGGGGIHATGNLTLTHVNVLSNTATFDGGGAWVNGAATLTGGLFQNNQGTSGFGGGLYVSNTLTLTDTQFLSNSAALDGGGVWVNGAATLMGGLVQNNQSTGGAGGGLFANNMLALIGTHFLSNTAESNGGGAWVNGPATLAGGLFQNNQSTTNDGGGLYVADALALTGTQFIGNAASSDGGGLYTFGALTLTQANVLSNTAALDGGGVWANGPATLAGGLFQNNQSTGGDGGGLLANDSLALSGAEFLGNTALFNGGGVYVVGNGKNSRVINTLFARNSAGGSGAALLLFDPTGAPGGTADILYTTLASPTLGAGQAISVGLGAATVRVTLTNSIVASYTTSIEAAPGASVVSDYNLFFNAPTDIITGSHSITNADPLFINPAGDNYHPAAGSPAIDRGTNAGMVTDLDGNPRPEGCGFDLGAYENQSAPLCALMVTTTGNGAGSVTPTVGTYILDYGTTVWLTATASTGSSFAGWSGAANGITNPISITMDANKLVTATFSLNTYTLTVATAGNGSGSVTSDYLGTLVLPPSTYAYGTVVTLTAIANTGSSFAGWSGAASGMTNPISITMDSDKLITATFNLNTYTLTVATAGNGSGSVTSDYLGTLVLPPSTYAYGTIVTLTATASTGSSFAGWSGAANGITNPVSITMDSDKSVTATFSLNTYTLTVATAGNGAGSVTPTVGAHPYLYGDIVTLTATANADSIFVGWSGDLVTTTNSATIVINSNQAVTATFTLACVAVSGADFAFAPAAPNVGQVVTFTGTVMAGTLPVVYAWSFGDSGISSGALVTHTFPVTTTLRAYSVTLTTSNACSAPPAVQRQIVVRPFFIYLPVMLRN